MSLPTWWPSFLQALVNGTPIGGQYNRIDFVGAGVTGAQDVANGRYTINIPAIAPSGSSFFAADRLSIFDHPLSGLGGVEGVSAGDIVLVAGQTNPVQNGVYVAAVGAWSRHTSFDAPGDFFPGLLIYIVQSAAFWHLSNTSSPSPGVDQIFFQAVSQVGGGGVTSFDALSDTPSYSPSVYRQLLGVSTSNTIQFLGGTRIDPADTLWYDNVSGAIVISSGGTQLDPTVPAALTNTTVLGAAAGSGLTGSPTNNTLIGAAAGVGLTTGTGNTLVGFAASVPAADQSDFINIGNALSGKIGELRIGPAPAALSAGDAMLELDTGVGPSAKAPLTLKTLTATVEVYTGSAVPTFSAKTGSLFLLASGAASELYQNRSAGTGTTWSPVGAGVTSNGFPRGHLDLLSPPVVPRDVVTWSIPAGECKDSSGTIDMQWSSSLAGNAAVVGAGGIDTGAIASNTLLALYVIWGSSPGYATVCSLSQTGGPTMPSGYTHYRLVGFAKTKVSAANFIQTYITGSGRSYHYAYAGLGSDRQVLTGGSQTTSTPIVTTSIFPANAATEFHVTYSNASNGTLRMSQTGNPATMLNLSCSSESRDFVGPFSNGTGGITYSFSTGGGSATVAGWGFRVSL